MMPERLEQCDTFFAPAARSPEATLRSLSKRILEDPILTAVLESVCAYAMVIDGNRQVIAANEALLSLLGVSSVDSILGKRPGETVSCVNASRGPGGCGTSRQCRHCGGVIAILAAQVNDHPVDGECTIACPFNGSARTTTFRVRVSPVYLAGERIYLSVFQDISASKRHELFGRVFLHDLSNVALGLLGWTAELPEGDDPEPVLRVRELAGRIAEQLDDQRALVQVESGGWHLNPSTIHPDALAQSLEIWFGAQACARNRKFVIEQTNKNGTLRSDPKLLNRVLGNLLKNAFEATPEGGTVRLTISVGEQQTRFDIHNPGCIPQEIAAQMLKQPVTTKSDGHGLGLYSVQLFGELYLGGVVSFESTAEHGTCFHFELPTARVEH